LLTLFALPKPFKGHTGIIQRNAITSWTHLKPLPEIILFGDEIGTLEMCNELGLQHIPDIKRNKCGTPLVSDLFEKAQQRTRYPMLCYVNADIILISDFMRAVLRVSQWDDPFLMVGQRWDVDIKEPWDFTRKDHEKELNLLIEKLGKLRPRTGIDYFVFPKGLYDFIPPFAIGRKIWDNWLVWYACHQKSILVDATKVITAVHQNHDYSNITFEFEEEQYNYEMAGGMKKIFTIADAKYRFTVDGLKRNLCLEHFRRKLEILYYSLRY